MKNKSNVKSEITRRQFSKTLLAGAAGFSLPWTLSRAAGSLAAVSPPKSGAEPFAFVLLGDLHFDRPEHHDFDWLQKEHPGDVGQSHNYSRITKDIHPHLFATVRDTIADLNKASGARVPFVLHVGDFVEGLCGNEKLAVQQSTDAVEFVRAAKLGVPFLFTKGNHDVTGPGATEAYKNVFYPFLSEQTASFKGGGKLQKAFYTIEHGEALFCCFDAYDNDSLDWLEAAMAKRTARHCFVIVHPPVVPYGARATWYLYSGDKEKASREKFLSLLGSQNVCVIGGHIHKFNTILRDTANSGKFAQLGVSSIINHLDVQASNILDGIQYYNGDQIRVEPKFSPTTEQERRAVYETEAPFVKKFEYADLPGYAVVTVDGANVRADMYSGVGRKIWKTVDMSKYLFS